MAHQAGSRLAVEHFRARVRSLDPAACLATPGLPSDGASLTVGGQAAGHSVTLCWSRPRKVAFSRHSGCRQASDRSRGTRCLSLRTCSNTLPYSTPHGGDCTLLSVHLGFRIGRQGLWEPRENWREHSREIHREPQKNLSEEVRGPPGNREQLGHEWTLGKGVSGLIVRSSSIGRQAAECKHDSSHT